MYTLIITLLYSYGVSTKTQEFSNKEACEKAAYEVVVSNNFSSNVKVECAKANGN